MASISDKWKHELNSLSQKDYIALTKAILFDLPEPKIAAVNQYIADRIFSSLRERDRAKTGMQKSRKNRNNSVKLQECYSNDTVTLQECYGNNSVTLQQEEKKEVSPLSSPLSSPPHPLISPPYNPPSPEKREESVSDAGARAIGRAEEQAVSLESRFDALWKLYPKKAGKVNAFSDYKRAVKDGVTDEEIADGIARYVEYINARNTDPQYILQGSTFFHQRRWTDEYTIPVRSQNADQSGDVFLDYLNEQLAEEQRKECWQ